MIWIILAALGVPLWMLAGALLLLYLRARSLGRREGDLAVRVRVEGAKRWHRGHAIWVHDVLAYSGTMTFWAELLVPATGASIRVPDDGDLHGLRRVDDPVIVSVLDDACRIVQVAASRPCADALLGPFEAGVLAMSREPASESTPEG